MNCNWAPREQIGKNLTSHRQSVQIHYKHNNPPVCWKLWEIILFVAWLFCLLYLLVQASRCASAFVGYGWQFGHPLLGTWTWPGPGIWWQFKYHQVQCNHHCAQWSGPPSTGTCNSNPIEMQQPNRKTMMHIRTTQEVLLCWWMCLCCVLPSTIIMQLWFPSLNIDPNIVPWSASAALWR